MKRDNLLSQAWTGEPLELNGRELVLSYGRQELLRAWGNELFCDGGTDQTAVHAMGEIALVCYSTMPEIYELRKMSREDRHEKVIDFMLNAEADMGRITQGIQDRIDAVKASMVESELLGKGDARHAP